MSQIKLPTCDLKRTEENVSFMIIYWPKDDMLEISTSTLQLKSLGSGVIVFFN